jgi:protein gp37
MHESLKGAMGYHHPKRPAVNPGPWPLPNVWLGVSVENQSAADERIAPLLQTPAAVRWLSCEPLLGSIDLTSIAWPDNISISKHGHRVDVLRGGYWVEKGCGFTGPSAALGASRGYFCNHSDMETIDWVIAGGESGPSARPMHPDWVRSLRDQCNENTGFTTPFFFKQWGEWIPVDTPSDEECYVEDGSDRQLEGRVVIDRIGNQPVARIGKKRAGRLLDGVEHNAYPGMPA